MVIDVNNIPKLHYVVYKITSPTNRIYVGSSKDFRKRMSFYKNLRCKQQVKLYASLNKYGLENHTIEILGYDLGEEMLTKEAFWGNEFKVLDEGNLNCFLPKIGDSTYTVSEEVRLKMSERLKGKVGLKKDKPVSDESRRRMSEAHTGKTLTEEHRRKISESLRGNNINGKLTLDLETGIFYKSLKEAYNSLNFNFSYVYLKGMLRGDFKNKTNLMYV